MKKLFYFIGMILITSSSFAQFDSFYATAFNQSPYLENSQYGTILVTPVLDSIFDGEETVYHNQAYAIKKEKIRWTTSQIINLKDTVDTYGYLKTETDPTIYSWAKQSTKPSYSYAELSGTPSLFSGAYNDLTGKPSLFSGNYNDLVSRPTLSSVAISGSYNDLIDKPTITSYTAGTGISLSGGVVTNTAPNQTVSLTAGNRISITGTYPNFTISYIEPTATTVTRTVNTNYTISSTKQANVFYSITSTATNPLLVGTSSGNAYLEYSTNSGTTWIGVSQAGNSNGVGVAVAIALTNGQTSVLSGTIPANALVRIRTVISGSATVAYAVGQETY